MLIHQYTAIQLNLDYKSKVFQEIYSITIEEQVAYILTVELLININSRLIWDLNYCPDLLRNCESIVKNYLKSKLQYYD